MGEFGEEQHFVELRGSARAIILQSPRDMNNHLGELVGVVGHTPSQAGN